MKNAAVPSGAEHGQGQPRRAVRAWRGAGPLVRRGLQDRPTYSSAERLHFGPNPWQQTSWDGRAAGNFIGGGAGGGLILFTALSGAQDLALTLLMLSGLALVGGGLLSVWFEIGRPLRALNVIFNPRSSWMSRESLVAFLLFPTGLAAAAGVAGAPLLAALLACLFVYCQARLVLAAKGIPAWREPVLLPLLLVTAATEGAGLLLFAQSLPLQAMARIDDGQHGLWALMATLMLARVLLWRNWRMRLSGRVPARASLAIKRAGGVLLMLGCLAPLALIVLVANGPSAAASALLLGLAGLAAALAGAWFKYALITRIAFNQGFALKQLPVRGVAHVSGAARGDPKGV